MEKEKSEKILNEYKDVFDSLKEYDKKGKFNEEVEKRIKRKSRNKTIK